MGEQLWLADGASFAGVSFGANSSAAGEVVFNTGMMGYPEALTDPSYKGQILTLTYPLIGNYGVPPTNTKPGFPHLAEYVESEKIQVSGLLVSDYSFTHSHWQAVKPLQAWLQSQNIPALFGIDTRSLTRKLREQGTMLGKIQVNGEVPLFDPNNVNLMPGVSIQQPITYSAGSKKVVVVDCGVKHNIIREFLDRNVTVIRAPWDYDFTNIDADGVFISNGPGDPKQCSATIENVKKMLKQEKPIFGICLGSQILALAAGADTYKLKYGHRGQNQPCIEEGTEKCIITSQNHGFAVNPSTLPSGWEAWFTNANDGTNEGIKHKEKPFFGVQFHPESHPGPTDANYIFDMFVRELK